MFDVPTAAGRSLMFGVSAAVHAALVLALVVPPLLATPEPPDPGVRMLPLVPVAMVRIGDAPARPEKDLLRKGNRLEAAAAARRATGAVAPPHPALAQPGNIPELLPAPTGEEPESPFEEAGERSEPGNDGEFGAPGARDDGDGGNCEGCKIISASAPGMTPPAPIETVSPAYPELARRAHVEGVIVVEAIIGADGLVRDVRVLRGASLLLDPAALEAVRRWRYRPARIGGRPVAVYLNVVVTFSLRNL